MEMYRAPVDLSQKALVPIDLFLSGELDGMGSARAPCIIPEVLFPG